MPPAAFLFSIAGLGVSLAGFSGLVAAFRRGAEWKPLHSYRLRQIPEMGLATAVLALLTVPIGDTIHNSAATIQVVSGLALLFTLGHAAVLTVRSRTLGLSLGSTTIGSGTVIDIAIVAAGTIGLAVGSAAAFEWLFVALLARPMIAFVLVLTELPAA